MIPAHLQNRTLEQLSATQETIRCFLVAPIGEGYESVIVTEKGNCVGGFDYHRSERVVRRFPLEANAAYPKGFRHGEPLRYCSHCGNYEFSQDALARPSGSMGRVWERSDTGERADHLNAFGPGAMWFVEWYRNDETGLYMVPGFGTQPYAPLCVRTPGGDWLLDQRASNCGKPDDSTHRCWVRHGTAPAITVDKNGDTCTAGGGGIVFTNWCGFLRDGYLVKC